jgi:colicin import membrane protein
MATGALQPSLLPPEQRGGLLGAGALALLAHALLIGALALGLNWRIRTPESVVSAELWSAVPQVAAPAPVEPPPQPAPRPAAPPTPAPTPAPKPVERRVEPAPTVPDAQIAIEKAEQRRRQQALEEEQKRTERKKAELQKAAHEKAEKEKAEKEKEKEAAEKLKQAQHEKDLARQKEAKAEEERLAKQREANLKRILGQANAQGAPSATGNAARDAAPSQAYAGRIKARIKPNIVLTADVEGNPTTEVEVRCAVDGTIIGRRVVKPSGNALWDDTVLRAIDRTEVLPRDVDGRVPGTMILVFPRRE